MQRPARTVNPVQEKTQARARIATVTEATIAREYARDEVCRLLHISEKVLATWERHGFVERRRHYFLRDLVALMTLTQLRKNRVRPERIRRILDALLARLRGVRDPLAELKIYCDGRRIAVQVAGRKMEPLSGQLLLDFDRDEMRRLLDFPTAPAAQAEALAAEARKRQGESWFEKGVALERNGAPLTETLAAYRKAVELDPGSAGAWLNLGTVYFNQRQWEPAEASYRKALEVRADYGMAHYNLGNLYDETGRPQEAVEQYKKALEIDPSYADAHYNLALLYQSAAEPLSALRHWRIYLRLEPAGYWAGVARREMVRLRHETGFSAATRKSL